MNNYALKKVWKFIKCAVCTVLFFVILCEIVIESSYIFRFDEDPVSTKAIQGFYAQDTNSTDIAFIGSSAIYRFNIAPVLYHEYGYTSCQFAAAQFPFEATVDAIKEVRKSQNPSLYVIDLRRFYLRYNDIVTGLATDEEYIEKNESFFSRLVNNMPVSFERASIIHKVVPDLLKQDELDWQFDYRRTHNNWKTIKMKDVSAYVKERLNQEAVKKSQKLKYLGANSKSAVKHFDPVDLKNYTQTATMTKEYMKKLDEVIDYIKDNKLNAIFLITPYPITEDLYAYEKFLTDYIDDTGIPLLNCNTKYEEIGIDFYSDYYDKKHTNTLGSYKYTKFLGKYLSENCKVEKHKLSDETKKEWETAYNNWWNNAGKPGIEKINKLCEG